MRGCLKQFVVATFLVAAPPSFGAVHYVDVNCQSPGLPYASWATAATSIQDAVDVAGDGDLILVTNGVYQTGGRVVYGALTNRVAIVKAVTVRSVNGPQATLIQGYGIVGSSAVRCVYMANQAALSGFTLTSGATRADGDGGTEQSGGGVWCESVGATVSNCVVSANKAYLSAGGVMSGTLINCIVRDNQASLKGNFNGYGGGAVGSVLNQCVITGNNAFHAGGAYQGTLTQCLVSNNSVSAVITWQHPYDYYFTQGGGLLNCNATNCQILNNSSQGFGGGVSADYTYSGTLVNCLLVGNGGGFGGGSWGGTLNNCTLVGNTSGWGAGAEYGTLNNCIIYYNYQGADCDESALNYCCTSLPQTNGVGNFTNAPLFVNGTNDFHLSAASPCVDAASSAYISTGVDLDNLPRVFHGAPDLGAYECQTNILLTVAAQCDLTNVPAGYPVSFSASVSKGRLSSWSFGDGTTASNVLSVTHAWSSLGDYPVVFTAYDNTSPAAVSATILVHVKSQILSLVSGLKPR